MNLKNATRNQHFIPRVEQALNATNPFARDENKKIYKFSVSDRENYSLALTSKNGIKISNSLSFIDLFSFDVLEKGIEIYNFENLFHRYESSIKYNTESIMGKLRTPGAEVKPEILNIFASKLFNFIRNPYSVEKLLNTFPLLKTIRPENPIDLANYKRVINGNKPQQEYLCRELGLSQDEYVGWLSIIFMLATPMGKKEQNFLDKIIKQLYESPEVFISVYIYTYDDKTCLLSDRGFSIPLPEDNHMSFDFNLCAHAFIRYVFSDFDKLVPKDTPNAVVELLKKSKKHIQVEWHENNLAELEQYNRNVVYQCFNAVFNSSTECYGL